MNLKISQGFKFSILGSFLWGIAIVNTRFMLNAGEDPINLLIWVNLIALPFWIWLFRKHRQGFSQLSRKHLFMLIVIGIVGSVGINLFQTLAIKNTTAINFSFLYRTVIVFTIIFAWIFFKEKITYKKIILVIIILIGSYFLTFNGKSISLSLGDIYSFLAAASAALIGNILVKHTVSKMHPDLSATVTMFVTIISLIVMGLVTHTIKLPHNPPLIVLGALLIFFQIRSRNFSYLHASASFVTMVYSLTPVFVSVLSIIFLHESLDSLQMFGGLLIISSGILVEKFKI